MQKQKNIRLLLVLGGLITLLTLLPFLREKSGLIIDKRQFTLDPQTVITDVILRSKEVNNKLSYVNGNWQINDSYELDPNMRDVFFSVLSQMEIRKTWPQTQRDSLTQLIKTTGTEVSILNNNELIKHYFIGGNANSQISYLMDEEENGYVLHIPGYRSYVAGIFQVPTSDWRSRRIFTAQFLNLNSVKIEYSTESIEFRYKDGFFEIGDIPADSTQLITSLENLLFLQTEQYLVPEEYAKYEIDSLVGQTPFVVISTTSLTGFKEKVKIYNSKNSQPYYVGLASDSSYCLFNKKRLNNILVKKTDFE
ncbi:hypothetical protein MNBD_BACTEROID06-452 [hydrothermal vent metagenome]|uniref:DUF4340 domain-containing protein n=1 Tax=hydrothermal vent metagenome TaxID=652676 RepID=A0A3B0UKF9_9ZZZZ